MTEEAPAVHPGCTCYHCQLGRQTRKLQDALQTVYAENHARAKEAKELREHLRCLGEQVGLLNQQVVGIIRTMNGKGEEGKERD